MKDDPRTLGAPLDPETAAKDIVLDQSVAQPTPIDAITRQQQALAAMQEQRDALADFIANPPPPALIDVPATQQIDPLMAIGAGLRAIGGDTGSLDKLLSQKQAIEQRQQEIEMANKQIMADHQRSLYDAQIDAMRIDLDGKKFDYSVAQAAAAEWAKSVATPEDASDWLNSNYKFFGSGQHLVNNPDGYRMASLMFGTNDRAELARHLNAGLFAVKPEPDDRGRKYADWGVFEELQRGQMEDAEGNLTPLSPERYEQLAREAEAQLQTMDPEYMGPYIQALQAGHEAAYGRRREQTPAGPPAGYEPGVQEVVGAFVGDEISATPDHNPFKEESDSDYLGYGPFLRNMGTWIRADSPGGLREQASLDRKVAEAARRGSTRPPSGMR